jgi:hypothetical protein
MSRSRIVDNSANNEQRIVKISRVRSNRSSLDHAELARREEALDEALRNTFPASDPISIG